MADETKTEKYDKTGYISYGNEIKVNHFVYDQVPDIGPLLAQGDKAIQTLRKESIESEDKAFEIIGAAVHQWEKQAAFTRSCNRALEYLNTPEVQHTNNTWKKLDYDQGEKISNRVFSMSWRIWETSKYDYKKHEDISVCYASWDLFLNTPRKGYGRRIAGQQDKRFTSRADAEKYLEGRKKAYSAFFIDISPPIPMKYRDAFMVHGHLLPGYTVEGMEPKRTEAEKPSVLGKLNEAREQDKAPPAPRKMKEGIEL